MAVVGDRGWESEQNRSSQLTATASYSTTNTVTWTCNNLGKKTIIITESNTASIIYKIVVRAYPSGNEHIFVEDTLAQNDTVCITLDSWYYDVQIAIKDGAGHGKCYIDYGGRLLA